MKKSISETILFLPPKIGKKEKLAIKVRTINEKLSSLALLSTNPPISSSNKNMRLILNELHAYLRNPHHHFNLSLHIEGTPFQKSVWKALQTIPSGTVVSYQELAKKLKTSPRAIGNACRANPIAIVIPCHRVVSKKGIGGYCGESRGKMLNIKAWLLHHEGIVLP